MSSSARHSAMDLMFLKAASLAPVHSNHIACRKTSLKLGKYSVTYQLITSSNFDKTARKKKLHIAYLFPRPKRKQRIQNVTRNEKQ